MDAAIPYAGFPHIFAEIATQCDFNTQCKLRLLCSSTKDEIDRLQCRRCIAMIDFPGDETDGGPPSIPVHATVYLRRRRFSPIPAMFVAHLPATLAERDAQATKLGLELAARSPPRRVSTTYEVLLWDRAFAEFPEYTDSAHLSPFQLLKTAFHLRLHHGHIDYLESLERLGPVPEVSCPTVPPPIEELHVSLYMVPRCWCDCSIRHSAELLSLYFEREVNYDEDEYSPLCGLTLDLFKPCVKRLFVETVCTEDAVEYLEAISTKSRHPELTVTIVFLDLPYQRKSDRKHPEFPSELAKKLERLIGVPVTLDWRQEVWPSLWSDN